MRPADALENAALADDPERAAGAFADDALLAYWNGTGEETAPRTLAHGRDAIRAALSSALGAWPAGDPGLARRRRQRSARGPARRGSRGSARDLRRQPATGWRRKHHALPALPDAVRRAIADLGRGKRRESRRRACGARHLLRTSRARAVRGGRELLLRGLPVLASPLRPRCRPRRVPRPRRAPRRLRAPRHPALRARARGDAAAGPGMHARGHGDRHGARRIVRVEPVAGRRRADPALRGLLLRAARPAALTRVSRQVQLATYPAGEIRADHFRVVEVDLPRPRPARSSSATPGPRSTPACGCACRSRARRATSLLPARTRRWTRS